jgi:rhamnulokinase
MTRIAAVDIGATSGRVLVFERTGDTLTVDEVHRFPNHPVEAGGRWTWDIVALWDNVVAGLRAAHARGSLDSWGVDTWGVDYAVVTPDGSALGPMYAYRDANHVRGVELADAKLSWADQYAVAGVQRLPFNTIYQLLAEREPERLFSGDVLLVPDLLMCLATGVRGTELTNASTMALIDARSREFSAALLERLQLEHVHFPPLQSPGMRRGLTQVAGLPPTPVVTVATHDTASAFAAVPMHDASTAAVLSLGTWALIGTELAEPVLTADACAANFTNEIGVENTVRFLKNITGMWLFEECRREWAEIDGREIPVPELLELAATAGSISARIDPDDPRWASPNFGADALAASAEGGVVESRGELVRCILESLAACVAHHMGTLARLTGRSFEVLHVVGGGSRIDLMMQLLANATQLPVIAGPVEATALGNAGVQFIANGDFANIAEFRSWLRTAQSDNLFHFVPTVCAAG